MRRRRDPGPCQKRLLSPEQEQAARELWAAGGSRDEVARAAGVTVDVIRARLNDQLADLPRRGRGGNRRPPSPDPSPEEIWGRLVLEAQARWTDEEREKAWVGSSNGRPTGH
jgi:hypothetical protein